MTSKNIIGVLLLAFAVSGLIYLAIKPDNASFAENKKQKIEADKILNSEKLVAYKVSAKSDNVMQGLKHVVVYYFHTTHRCMTCKRIEDLSKEVIEENYDGQLSDESLLFRPLNTDLAVNKHYLKDFNLYTKSLIVTIEQNSKIIKWKNCPEIWELVHRAESYEKYVMNEVDAYLEEL